jgi:hypothetical protein
MEKDGLTIDMFEAIVNNLTRHGNNLQCVIGNPPKRPGLKPMTIPGPGSTDVH